MEKLAISQKTMSNNINNRRNFLRLPIDSAIEIWTDQQSWEGVLVNQSIGGVGLLLEATPDLNIGDEIRARYNDAEAFGFVRHVREVGGSAYVGISWDQRERARKERKAHATFFTHGPLEVVCRSCVVENDGDMTFTLWDGAEFSTSTCQVATRAIADRQKKLTENRDELCTLAKLYQLGNFESLDTALERVIDFEFTR